MFLENIKRETICYGTLAASVPVPEPGLVSLPPFPHLSDYKVVKVILF